MPAPVLRTVDIARACGIHVNTVRFYERVGLISPVPRDERNYRAFSPRHLYQVKVLRLLYAGEWPGKAVRRGAEAIVRQMKAWELEEARRALVEYARTLEREIDNARQAVGLLGDWDRGVEEEASAHCYEIAEVAEMLNVTREAIRNWERNNLLSLPRRGANRERYATSRELNQLRVIAVLRKSGHSIAVIHRALGRLRSEGWKEAMAVFSEPEELEIFSAGDHYLEVLQAHRERAKTLRELLEEIPEKI